MNNVINYFQSSLKLIVSQNLLFRLRIKNELRSGGDGGLRLQMRWSRGDLQG